MFTDLRRSHLLLCSVAFTSTLSLQANAATLVGATAGELDASPSGSVGYSIPIAVPVGTTGLQPKITLQYDSLAGNGPAGMGWSVGGLPLITRCPTSVNIDGGTPGFTGVDPVDYDDNDKFCLGNQRLVLVSGTYGRNGAEYRTTQEEFSKIVSYGYGTAGSGPAYFKVWRKSGEVLEFGNTVDSRIEALGKSDVWVWAINKLSDTAGNYETFSYTEDADNGGFRISRIDYTGNDAQALQPYNHIDFLYAPRPDISTTFVAGSKITQDQRLTNIKVYADTNLFRDYQVAYDASPHLSGRSRPISLTECALNSAGGTDCFPATTFQWSDDGQATLSTISLYSTTGNNSGIVSGDASYNVATSGDFNGDGRMDLYLVKMNDNHQAFSDPNYLDQVWLADGNGGFQKLRSQISLPQNYTVEASGDFNGDGLTDFYAIRINSDNQKANSSNSSPDPDYLYLSNGDGTFNRTAKLLAELGQKVFTTGDFNGDGITDLFLLTVGTDGRISYASNHADVLLGATNGEFRKIPIGLGQGINIIAYDNYAIPATGDFNGDGLTDLYVFNSDRKFRKSGSSNDHYWTAKWIPDGTSGTLTFVDTPITTQSFAAGYGIASSGDFNGDGLIDFYTIKMDSNGRGEGNTQDYTWLSKGNLGFQVVPGLAGGTQILDEFKVTGSGDFNGDGMTDLYVMPTQDDRPNGSKTQGDDYILISNGDGHFTRVLLYDPHNPNDPNGPALTPGLEEYEVKATGDFNGDGLTDLYLYHATREGLVRGASSNYPDDKIFLSTWHSPDQLTGITNGLGLNTTLVYKPLTDSTVYTKGTGSAYPVQDVIAPRYVLSDIQADNGVGGKNVQSYTYSGLRTHVNDIGNLGFATVTATDRATGIVTASTYSQDWVAHSEGLLTHATTTAPGGVVLSDQQVTWAVADGTTADATPLRFRYSPSTTTIKNDLNGAPLGTVTETTDYSDGTGDYFANYGFPRQVTVTTLAPDGANTYTQVTDNTYKAADVPHWILGRLATAQVTHRATGKADIVRNSAFTYAGLTGLLTSETVSPADPLSYKKTYAYDGFGAATSLTETWGALNASSVTNPDGTALNPGRTRVTSYTYDARRRYKVSETNPLSQGETTTHDAVTGAVTSTTGPNNLTTQWPAQDAFGRPLQEIRADGTYTTTTRTSCVGDMSCPANAALKIVTKSFTPTGVTNAPTQTVYQDVLYREIRKTSQSLMGTTITVDTVYDALGREIQKSEPYFPTDTVYWTQITYDLLGRPTKTTRPDSSTQKLAYNGLSQVSTNELGQTKTVLKDVMGRDAVITDAAGTNIVNDYDAIGQLTSTWMTDSAGAVIAGTTSSFAYDVRGNKISDSDPDKGTWTYNYNALGLLTKQIDAKGQSTQMTYDVLGRMLSRSDTAGGNTTTANWVYDTAPLGTGGALAKGKLASVSMPNYTASYTYDSLLRQTKISEVIEGATYNTSTSYTPSSQPQITTYPSGLKVRNYYNIRGYVTSISNQTTGTVYWSPVSDDARGNITEFKLGDASGTGNFVIDSLKVYDPQRGWITSIASNQIGSQAQLQNLTYTFNKVGNLTRRGDGEYGPNPLTETLTYDNLNQLRKSYVQQQGISPWQKTVNVTYDALGNMLSKSDVGTYTYGLANSDCGGIAGGTHAVTNVNGAKVASYCYDRNGNMVSGDGRTIAYSPFDLPVSVTKGTSTVTFAYGPDRQRYKRVDQMPTGITTTVYAAGGSYEKIWRPDGSYEQKVYVGDFAVVTAATSMGATTTTTAYVLGDHLGSLDTLTDVTGNIVQKMSFDAWGKRRNANWTVLGSPLYFDTSITTRGFTGHEEVDQVALVHMNGRVYDPELGRFLSADPFVQDATNSQSFNRYSYVLNNPLSMTDPTGFFFGSIINAIGNFFGNLFSGIVSIFRAALKIPLIRSVIQIAACVGPLGPMCVAVTGALALAAGGGIGDAIKAMAFTVASYEIWGAVGGFLKTAESTLTAANVLLTSTVHGVVNGALSLVQGGTFQAGFISGAIGQAAGMMVGASGSPFNSSSIAGEEGMLVRSVLAGAAGGAATELTGGKFADGFLTAAFAQMWNDEMSPYDGHHSVPREVLNWLRINGYSGVLEDGRIVGVRGSPNIFKILRSLHREAHQSGYNAEFIRELQGIAERSGGSLTADDVLSVRNSLMLKNFPASSFKNPANIEFFRGGGMAVRGLGAFGMITTIIHILLNPEEYRYDPCPEPCKAMLGPRRKWDSREPPDTQFA